MINNGQRRKIFLATGGSGGHIFPAVAVAEKLSNEGNNICIVSDSIYEKYSNNNLNHRIINSGKTLTSFSDVKNIIKGFFQAKSLINFERPDLVIGFGSYATLPMLMACKFTGTPFILHEQNAYIGKINKLFGRYAKKIMTTYHELYGVKFNDMEKIVYTGSPVRQDIKSLYDAKYEYPKDSEKFIIVITGGSAGARIFSEYLPKVFDITHKAEQKNLKVYHQVRPEYIDSVKDHYKLIGLDAEVSPFFNNMKELLSKAHLVIGRAGSGTLCETAVAGRPSIFIPLPSHGNNRQDVNAKNFEDKGAGIMILEKDFNIRDFRKVLFDLIKDKNRLEEMSKNAKKIAVIDADDNILNVIKEVLK